MATWCCPTCGHEKEARCKPKTCPDCDQPVEFAKKGEAPAAAGPVKGAKPAKAAKAAEPAKATKKK